MKHITEIRTKPNVYGNSRRLLIFQECNNSAVEVYRTDEPNERVNALHHATCIHLTLQVTPKEFAEYARLAKAQETRRKQEQG